jgi:hypothetical protein
LGCYQAVRQITAVNAKVELRRVRFPELFDAVRASVAAVLAACDLAKAFRLLAGDLGRVGVQHRAVDRAHSQALEEHLGIPDAPDPTGAAGEQVGHHQIAKTRTGL